MQLSKILSYLMRIGEEGILVNETLEIGKALWQKEIPITQNIAYYLLQLCHKRKDLSLSRRVHHLILHSGLDSVAVLGDHLIRIFACHGCLVEANYASSKVMNPTEHTWAAIMFSNANLGQGKLVLQFYDCLLLSSVKSNTHILVALLKACTLEKDLIHGRNIHEHIIQRELQFHVFVGNTMVDMYAKCGSLQEAYEVFKNLPSKDVVSWNAMIVGYIQHGECLLVLSNHEKMRADNIQPNEVTLLCLLKACANIGALEEGRFIHENIIRIQIQTDVVIGSTLVDMYAKCGSLQEADEVFGKLAIQDVVSWGSMVAGYAQNGEALLALQCFEKMQQEGVMPNDALFTNILVACSYGGFVEEGHKYHKSMIKDHGIAPTNFHCSCITDLLCRAGLLSEAEMFLRTTVRSDNIEGIIMGWTSLLTACRMHGDVELGKCCFNEIVALDPCCGGAYVLMSNVFADALMQKEALEVEDLRLRAGGIGIHTLEFG